MQYAFFLSLHSVDQVTVLYHINVQYVRAKQN